VSSEFNPETANVLPNGAEILDRCSLGRTWVWMAYWSGHYMPYVTWLSSTDNPGDTFWGHYFLTAEQAQLDFSERCL
jgi:hypothetical protein